MCLLRYWAACIQRLLKVVDKPSGGKVPWNTPLVGVAEEMIRRDSIHRPYAAYSIAWYFRTRSLITHCFMIFTHLPVPYSVNTLLIT